MKDKESLRHCHRVKRSLRKHENKMQYDILGGFLGKNGKQFKKKN